MGRGFACKVLGVFFGGAKVKDLLIFTAQMNSLYLYVFGINQTICVRVYINFIVFTISVYTAFFNDKCVRVFVKHDILVVDDVKGSCIFAALKAIYKNITPT